MSNFRFGIMGAAKIANKFCEAVALLDNCEVCAISSKSYDRAKDFATKHGINKYYDNYIEMLEAEKPDCVYIAVTNNDHYRLTMMCVERGIPVLCEKAMFQNSDEAQKVFEAAAENTIATMHHTVGVVEIPVKASADGKQLQRVGLNSKAANQALRGDFNITPEAPYTLTSTYGYFDNYNQIASDSPIDLSTSEVKSMFVPAFPGTYSTIDVKYQLVGESEKTIKTGHQLVVESGKITKISEMTLE